MQLGSSRNIAQEYFERVTSVQDGDLDNLVEEIKGEIAKMSGETLMAMAYRLFNAGRKDDAVFWYYAGDIRFRKYRAILKDPGQLSVLNALMGEYGRPINDYAFRDPKGLASRIEQVIQWDEDTPCYVVPVGDNAIPAADWAKVGEGVRNGFVEMVSEIREHNTSLRRSKELSGEAPDG